MTQTDPNLEQRTGYGVEELQIMGEQLLSKVKEVIHEGNVRRLIIKQDGRTLLEIPLTVGVAGVVLAPVWAAIGVLGALIAQCTIEVVRSDSPVDEVKETAQNTYDNVKETVQNTYDDITPPENPASF